MTGVYRRFSEGTRLGLNQILSFQRSNNDAVYGMYSAGRASKIYTGDNAHDTCDYSLLLQFLEM